MSDLATASTSVSPDSPGDGGPAMPGFGVIGWGLRSNALFAQRSPAQLGVRLAAVFDTDRTRMAKAAARLGDERTVLTPDAEALCRDPRVQWVLVMSPNDCHAEHVLAGLKAGKHVFAEKPLATSIDDCVAIMQECSRRPEQIFATGFVLRYSPVYRQAKALLASGAIGTIVAVEASENITAWHGGHIMTNWRRFAERSGSHLLEKCCHDLDQLLWLVDDVPLKVASFGGQNIFTPEHAANLEKYPRADGRSLYHPADIAEREERNPFTSDKTIMDNQVAILEFSRGARATFVTTLCNARPERRMRFVGTEGNLTIEAYTGVVTLAPLGENAPESVWTFAAEDGHGGGDAILMDELAEAVSGGKPFAAGGEEGLRSAAVALGLEAARKKGGVEDLSPVWGRLGVPFGL